MGSMFYTEITTFYNVLLKIIPYYKGENKTKWLNLKCDRLFQCFNQKGEKKNVFSSSEKNEPLKWNRSIQPIYYGWIWTPTSLFL